MRDYLVDLVYLLLIVVRISYWVWPFSLKALLTNADKKVY